MNATRIDEDFTSSVHVYEPHRAGLPRLRPYFRALWQRRQFAAELSRTGMRAANTNTAFGQLWLVINPLLLAVVYYLLVAIIGGGGGDSSERFVHLCAGLFFFYYFSGALQGGASSVVGGSSLLLNLPFPKLLLPLSAVRTAFFRFLPTLIVYIPIHVAFGHPLRWQMVLGLFFLVTLTLFAAGMAMVFGTLQVYFRDTASFLPYFVRIWLYLSPVLWYPEMGMERLENAFGDVGWLMYLNPLFSMIGGWTDLIVRGVVPGVMLWLSAALWATAALLLGGWFFLSREREFVVRL
jgi:ABC-type polysaccharide/polyol phosphate export permease